MRTKDFDYLMVVTFMDRPGVDERMEQYKRENRAAMARQAERRAARQAFWRRVKAWFAGLVSGGRQAPLRRPTLQGGF